LIDEYEAIGDVSVQVIVFNATGAVGTVWVDSATAKSYVSGITATGRTNYDDPLIDVMETYDNDGKLSSPQSQNVAYFLSDGIPNEPSGSQGINNAEQAQWESFAETNDINVFALGMTTAAVQSTLNPIAYNGVEETGGGNTADAVIVANLNDLDDVLLSTVEPDSITGTLVEAYGADEEGYVKSIVINSSTYIYDPDGDGGDGSITVTGTDKSSFDTSDNTLTITTANGGKFVVNMDTGDYEYFSTSTPITSSYTESITYQIADADGDIDQKTGTITVDPPTIGTSGSDTLTGGSNSDYLMGEDGNDNLTGNDGDDVLIGGIGTDTLNGGDGDDVLVYDISDTIYGGLGTDTLFVKADEIIDFETNLTLLSNIEILELDHGARVLDLSATDVSLLNTSSELKILGDETAGVQLSGSWTVGSQVVEDGITFNLYTSGSSSVKVQDGVYLLTIDDGSGNTLQGINSGSEDDWLIGNGGNDVLNGGAGDDLLDGGSGNDSLNGGDGNDILIYDPSDGASAYDGGSGVDTILLEDGDDLNFANSSVTNKFHDIEILDLASDPGTNSISNLEPSDVLNITDATNDLYILRGINDLVDIDSFGSRDQNDQSVTINGEVYIMDVWIQSGVTLYIQDVNPDATPN